MKDLASATASVLTLLTFYFLLPGDVVAKKHKPEACYEVADIGDEVNVHYTGMLETGQIFDTSKQADRGPLPFVLGEGKVIPGWEQGIHGMCVGEKRKLTIPPHLAYGRAGHPPTIPPEATLTFETELVSVNKKSSSFDIIGLVRFLAVPAIAIYCVYYLYEKYNKEQKEIKEKKGKKKRH